MAEYPDKNPYKRIQMVHMGAGKSGALRELDDFSALERAFTNWLARIHGNEGVLELFSTWKHQQNESEVGIRPQPAEVGSVQN